MELIRIRHNRGLRAEGAIFLIMKRRDIVHRSVHAEDVADGGRGGEVGDPNAEPVGEEVEEFG